MRGDQAARAGLPGLPRRAADALRPLDRDGPRGPADDRRDQLLVRRELIPRGIAIGEEARRGSSAMAGGAPRRDPSPSVTTSRTRTLSSSATTRRYRYEETLRAGDSPGRRARGSRRREDVFSVLTPPGTEGRRDVPPYWSQLLSGTIAADILDYLARDAYFTGLRIQVDERVHSYFKVDGATGNLYIDLAKHELLREDILSEIVRMLEGALRVLRAGLLPPRRRSRPARSWRARSICSSGRERWARATSTTPPTTPCWRWLLRAGRKVGGELEETVRDLVGRFRGRKLLKRACVFPAYENEKVQAELVDRFFAAGGGTRGPWSRGGSRRPSTSPSARRCGSSCTALRRRCSSRGAHPRAVAGSRGGASALRLLRQGARLGDLERSYRDLWKFYVLCDSGDPDVLAKVQEIAAAEFPGVRNVYSLGS